MAHALGVECGIIRTFSSDELDCLRMPWHRLAVSTVPAHAERVYDLSLRVLMGAVAVTLIACIGFLTWRWLNPTPVPSSMVQLTAVSRTAHSQVPMPEPVQTATAQVLLKPGQMYRCERNGRVTFSDLPCTEGSSRVMSLPVAK
jgi:hypothetical protein